MNNKLDSILTWIHRLSLIGFMISILFIVIGDDLFKNVIFSVLTLYIFIGISYVNHSRTNNANNDKVTIQIAGIVLGTVIIIIAITLMFKLISATKIL